MSIASVHNAPSLRHLVGKVVVVIGGSSGMGYSVAQASLEHGAKVIISSSIQAKIDAALTSLVKTNPLFEGSISGLMIDAKDGNSIQAFWDAVGKFDHLVWTAGDGFLPNFMDADLETQKGYFDVRFWAPVLSAKYAYKKGLFNAGASITLSSGVMGHKPLKGFGMTAAVTGAVESFTRGLAVELAPIRVNTVSPGACQTPIWDLLPTPDRVATWEAVAEQSLVKHIAQPEELAEAYLFLMKCTNMTGQIIDCEGGALLV